MAKLYHYHPETGEYLKETNARLDPIDKTPMVPGHATLTAPPAAQSGKARVFANGAWSLVEDNRGLKYWTADGTEHEVSDLGPLPAGAQTKKPDLPKYPTEAAANTAMLGWVNGLTVSLDAGLSDAEIRAKTKKAAAARAHLSATATPEQTKMLSDEVALTGETIDTLAAKIRAKADRDDEFDAQVAGLRRFIKAQLAAETDPFNYEVILNNGKAQAIALAASLGITVP